MTLVIDPLTVACPICTALIGELCVGQTDGPVAWTPGPISVHQIPTVVHTARVDIIHVGDVADTAGGADVATRFAPRMRITADVAGGTDVATRGRIRSADDDAGGFDVATGVV